MPQEEVRITPVRTAQPDWQKFTRALVELVLELEHTAEPPRSSR